jgi:hypothetical protein
MNQYAFEASLAAPTALVQASNDLTRLKFTYSIASLEA